MINILKTGDGNHWSDRPICIEYWDKITSVDNI